MKVYVVYTNEFNYKIAKIFTDKNKATQFIQNGNGEYMDVIDTFELE